MKPLNIAKMLWQVIPAINTLLEDKKTNMFNIVFAVLTVFKPELIEQMVNGARTLADGQEAFTMDPKTQALIVLLNMVNMMLRNWSVMWGQKKPKAIQAQPVNREF